MLWIYNRNVFNYKWRNHVNFAIIWRKGWEREREWDHKTFNDTSGRSLKIYKITFKISRAPLPQVKDDTSLTVYSGCSESFPIFACHRGRLYCPPHVSGYAKSEAKNCVQHFHMILMSHLIFFSIFPRGFHAAVGSVF